MTTIVLLPGMDGTGKLFAPFVEYLPKEWSVVVVRYPKNEPLGYEALEKEARKAIPTSGNYFLLGESFSGPIAITLAKSADSRLLGLILCCTFMRCPSKLLRHAGSVLSQYPVSKVPFFLIEIMLLGNHQSTALSRLLRSSVRVVSDAAYKARLRAIRNVEVSEQLASLAMPVLYLRAAEDRLIEAQESEAMRGILKHLSVSELEGPHCLLQACAEQSAHEVIRFVAGLNAENGSNKFG